MRIAVLSTSRADYGLLYWILKNLQKDLTIDLHLILCGEILLPQMNSLRVQIEAEGFSNIHKLLVNDGETDRSIDITHSVGKIISGAGKLLEEIGPDMLCLLGDRFETFSFSTSAYIQKIPIAHIHGGEVTEGAFDEAFRHSITKMSSLHFTSTDSHRQRVIQLGEYPDTVFNYGAPGLDHLFLSPKMNKLELQNEIGLDLNNKTLLITYHPVTLHSEQDALAEISEVLASVEEIGAQAIFTRSNIDAHAQIINDKIQHFCLRNPNKYKFFDSLGQKKYFSALAYTSAIVGNSSSGIIEAASFNKPVVNIGHRQKGRQCTYNVIHCDAVRTHITESIKKALSHEFAETIRNVKNPYQSSKPGTTSELIVKKIIEFIHVPNKIKSFYDIK